MLDPKPFLRVLEAETEAIKARGERAASRGIALVIAGLTGAIAYVFAMLALQSYLAWHIGQPGAWAAVAAVTAAVAGVILLIGNDSRQRRRVQLAELQAQKAKLESEVELARLRTQFEALRRAAELPAGEKAALIASYLLRKLQDR